MGHVAVVLVIALAASVAAGLLSYRFRMKLAVVAGVASVALMALASGLFYFGIMDALSQDKFSGWTNWNKSDTIITGPLIGWWMPLCAVTVQTFQVGILLYAMRRRRFLE